MVEPRGDQRLERSEHEFKSRNNLDLVDELMSPRFVHHLPFAGLSPGARG